MRIQPSAHAPLTRPTPVRRTGSAAAPSPDRVELSGGAARPEHGRQGLANALDAAGPVAGLSVAALRQCVDRLESAGFTFMASHTRLFGDAVWKRASSDEVARLAQQGSDGLRVEHARYDRIAVGQAHDLVALDAFYGASAPEKLANPAAGEALAAFEAAGAELADGEVRLGAYGAYRALAEDGPVQLKFQGAELDLRSAEEARDAACLTGLVTGGAGPEAAALYQLNQKGFEFGQSPLEALAGLRAGKGTSVTYQGLAVDWLGPSSLEEPLQGAQSGKALLEELTAELGGRPEAALWRELSRTDSDWGAAPRLRLLQGLQERRPEGYQRLLRDALRVPGEAAGDAVELAFCLAESSDKDPGLFAALADKGSDGFRRARVLLEKASPEELKGAINEGVLDDPETFEAVRALLPAARDLPAATAAARFLEGKGDRPALATLMQAHEGDFDRARGDYVFLASRGAVGESVEPFGRLLKAAGSSREARLAYREVEAGASPQEMETALELVGTFSEARRVLDVLDGDIEALRPLASRVRGVLPPEQTGRLVAELLRSPLDTDGLAALSSLLERLNLDRFSLAEPLPALEGNLWYSARVEGPGADKVSVHGPSREEALFPARESVTVNLRRSGNVDFRGLQLFAGTVEVVPLDHRWGDAFEQSEDEKTGDTLFTTRDAYQVPDQSGSSLAFRVSTWFDADSWALEVSDRDRGDWKSLATGDRKNSRRQSFGVDLSEFQGKKVRVRFRLSGDTRRRHEMENVRIIGGAVTDERKLSLERPEPDNALSAQLLDAALTSPDPSRAVVQLEKLAQSTRDLSRALELWPLVADRVEDADFEEHVGALAVLASQGDEAASKYGYLASQDPQGIELPVLAEILVGRTEQSFERQVRRLVGELPQGTNPSEVAAWFAGIQKASDPATADRAWNLLAAPVRDESLDERLGLLQGLSETLPVSDALSLWERTAGSLELGESVVDRLESMRRLVALHDGDWAQAQQAWERLCQVAHGEADAARALVMLTGVVEQPERAVRLVAELSQPASESLTVRVTRMLPALLLKDDAAALGAGPDPGTIEVRADHVDVAGVRVERRL